jgi:GNAT superfamily N-acetyltransferase
LDQIITALATNVEAVTCHRCERDWFPPLLRNYPIPHPSDDSPDARIIRAIHAGRSVPTGTEAFPAHMHLDLLPIAQGQGWGRKLRQTLIELKITGVLLDVGPQNERTIGLYEQLGFRRLVKINESLYMGKPLTPS